MTSIRYYSVPTFSDLVLIYMLPGFVVFYFEFTPNWTIFNYNFLLWILCELNCLNQIRTNWNQTYFSIYRLDIGRQRKDEIPTDFSSWFFLYFKNFLKKWESNVGSWYMGMCPKETSDNKLWEPSERELGMILWLLLSSSARIHTQLLCKSYFMSNTHISLH